MALSFSIPVCGAVGRAAAMTGWPVKVVHVRSRCSVARRASGQDGTGWCIDPASRECEPQTGRVELAIFEQKR